MKEKTCCFTGHREIPSGQRRRIFAKTEEAIEGLIKKGYLYFGAGGALGFDTIAAFAVLKLKERYPDIRLILVLPCFSQTRGWSQEDIEIYDDIKQKADKVVYTLRSTRGAVCINAIAIWLITVLLVFLISQKTRAELFIQ